LFRTKNFSFNEPDEQTSEQVLQHTIHREIHEINRIVCNAIISGIPYTSDAADKVEVAKVLDKVDSALARVQ
jgi:hypothetical protein